MWQRRSERGGEGLRRTLIWIARSAWRRVSQSQPWLFKAGKTLRRTAHPPSRAQWNRLRRPVLRAAQVFVPIAGGYAMTLRTRVRGCGGPFRPLKLTSWRAMWWVQAACLGSEPYV